MIVFFFNATATSAIYTLSLHDALPICGPDMTAFVAAIVAFSAVFAIGFAGLYGWIAKRLSSREIAARSEEHTSELQSRRELVCRLLLVKKKAPSVPPYADTEDGAGPSR